MLLFIISIKRIIQLFFSITVLIILSTKCFGSTNHFYNNDTLSKNQIDSIATAISKSLVIVKKLKKNDSSYVFNLEKNSGLILAVSIRSKKDGSIVSMVFFNKQIIRLVFKPRKKSKIRTGAVYYFHDNRLFYKEEYSTLFYKLPLKYWDLYFYYKSLLF